MKLSLSEYQVFELNYLISMLT